MQSPLVLSKLGGRGGRDAKIGLRAEKSKLPLKLYDVVNRMKSRRNVKETKTSNLLRSRLMSEIGFG